ncbi:hypothetical protein [Photorhabdus aegyptia]|uniref:Uncharacterized protein n=1 Tax=Photorhabdus aegyptia TaxID=2805098 RepID=A0A022PM21_9GAMM|nr:hypothetical protein [Photorhabdus aegyptia]EYU16569.1 hypothetical protein BA1DRAFT_00853 [Photorhabdus aegyptia]
MNTIGIALGANAETAFNSIFADLFSARKPEGLELQIRESNGNITRMIVPSGTPVFLFGSEELEDFHRDNASHGQFYIVDYGGFRTLNNYIYDPCNPIIRDIV